MAITKEVKYDKTEIVGDYKAVQCREATIIKEDGKEIINFDEYKSKKIEEIEQYDTQLEFNKILKIMQKTLKLIDREIMFLWFKSYKYHEIAKKLKIKQGTVGSRINRNYEKIREEFFKKNV